MDTIQNLVNLLRCHSTPGDEDEVRKNLISRWDQAGLTITQHGQYAVSARLEKSRRDKPTILVCAHMDSPGYIVEKIDNNAIQIIKLGSPYFTDESISGVIKTKSKKIPVKIERHQENDLKEYYSIHCKSSVDHGDRVCFAANPKVDENGVISSPFLDNRMGCFVLNELASDKNFLKKTHGNLVLGATACEEVGCIGATVLAAAIKPDFVICVDATYENPQQNVIIGKGPVLTLSDASVIISCEMRDKIKKLFQTFKIPIQTEVYNYSGTDAKAFPLVGLDCPVLALLIASSGNHTPREVASIHDIFTLVKTIKIIINNIESFYKKL